MSVVKIGSLIFGIDRRKKGDKLIPKMIVDCDGFIFYKKLVRRDWKASVETSLIDNVKNRSIDQLAKCSSSCPEVGSEVEGGSGSGW